jgi:hypothetical protein
MNTVLPTLAALLTGLLAAWAPAQTTGKAPQKGKQEAPKDPKAPKSRTAVTTLQDARGAFVRVDGDRNRVLTEAEAAKAALDRKAFRAADLDGDKKLSQDEFIVGYHRMLAGRRRAVASDLEAESTRLQALSMARRAQAMRRSAILLTGREGVAGPAGASLGPAARLQATQTKDPGELARIEAQIARERKRQDGLRPSHSTYRSAEAKIAGLERRRLQILRSAPAVKKPPPENSSVRKPSLSEARTKGPAKTKAPVPAARGADKTKPKPPPRVPEKPGKARPKKSKSPRKPG